MANHVLTRTKGECGGRAEECVPACIAGAGAQVVELMRAAQAARQTGDYASAARLFEGVIELNPVCHDALLALGAMLVATGAAERARPLLQWCCDLAPRNAEARHAYGLALHMCNAQEPAFRELALGHLLDRGNALCAVNLVDVAARLGRVEEILSQICLERTADPKNAALLTAAGAALAHLQRRTEALDFLEAATLIDPQSAVAAAMYGDMLARSSRQADAEVALRQAMLLDGHNTDSAMALSVVLMRLHRHVEAAELLDRLLADGVPPVGPLCNLSTAYAALGRQDDAVNAARSAIALAPGHPSPYRALCNALPYHPDVNGASLLAAAREACGKLPRASLPALRNSRIPDRRLRVGIVSGTLRAHPVGWLTVAAFENLDRREFELICLAGHAPEDGIGRRFAAAAAEWEETTGLDDVALARRARELNLDLAIDLGGYGDLGRLPAFAHRLAPVQMKWVGMQNHSTGVDEIDWFITDRWESPSEMAHLYGEKLLVMPDGYVCYSPPEAPAVDRLPALSEAPFTFGCFNNLAKITPQVIELWSRVLAAVPQSRLLLKAHQFNTADTCAAMRGAFLAQGVAEHRIVLRGSSPHYELLRQYRDVDMVLDPFPYSGGLTTCEALWMGVPTLTMPGDTFASRHSASHLSNVGLSEWIVPDRVAYLDRAAYWPGELQALERLRLSLRERVRSSPLCDGERFGAAFGHALRAAWRTYCFRH